MLYNVKRGQASCKADREQTQKQECEITSAGKSGEPIRHCHRPPKHDNCRHMRLFVTMILHA